MNSVPFNKKYRLFLCSFLVAVISFSVVSVCTFANEADDENLLGWVGRSLGVQVNDRSYYSDYDRDRLEQLARYLRENKKPADLRGKAQWYVGLAKVIPSVLLSAQIDIKEFPWAFENHNLNATMGPYSAGEAMLPLGFLRSIYSHLFPENPIDLQYRSFSPAPGSIPFSPLTLGLVDAVVGTGIHVLTAELKAHILMNLFHAPDSAYSEWEDDISTPVTERPSPRLVRLKIAQALANNYWISANSELVQSELVSLLHYEDVMIRAYIVKAAAAGTIGWSDERRKALVDSIIEELPVHINGADGLADEHATYINCALEALEQLSLWLTDVRPLARSVLLALKQGIVASHGQLAFARGRPDLAGSVLATMEKVQASLKRGSSDCATWLTNPPRAEDIWSAPETAIKPK